MDSPEYMYKALLQCYPALTTCVQQSPNDIAAHLIPSGILTLRDMQYLSNHSIPDDEKARLLLDIVVNQMKTDPQVYHTFIAALKNAGPWIRKAVSDLEQTYVSLIQSPVTDVPSTEEPGKSFVFEFHEVQPPHAVHVCECQ